MALAPLTSPTLPQAHRRHLLSLELVGQIRCKLPNMMGER